MEDIEKLHHQMIDLAEGKRLLDELRWTQAYPDDDRTAAIDNAQLSRLIDLVHTLLSLAERTQQMEALLFAVDKAYSEGYALPAFVLQVARSMVPPFDAVLTKEATDGD